MGINGKPEHKAMYGMLTVIIVYCCLNHYLLILLLYSAILGKGNEQCVPNGQEARDGMVMPASQRKGTANVFSPTSIVVAEEHRGR